MHQNLTHISRKLRQESTEVEEHLWYRLRGKQLEGVKFRRQEQMGNYIVDFVAYEKHLVIELDGGQHAILQEKDIERDKWLESQGFKVLRFWNHEVLTNLEGILEVVREACVSPPHPDPLPPGEREHFHYRRETKR